MDKKTTILVTGAGGQLGSELKVLSPLHSNIHFVFASKEELPVDDLAIVSTFFRKHQPAFCVNCAAYTAVDKAESEKEHAFRVNAQGAKNLAETCGEQDCRLIHISTDYVFDGKKNKPYLESDETGPINVYGASKLEGEKHILSVNNDSIIIRTSWVYSSFGKNFVKTMLRLMPEKEEIKVVNDQVGAPTYAADLAEAILQIILSGKWIPGIFNYSNAANISWYEFALSIREISGYTCRIVPITTAEYPTAARRPANSVLDTTRISETYPVRIKDWKESLKNCIAKINNESIDII